MALETRRSDLLSAIRELLQLLPRLDEKACKAEIYEIEQVSGRRYRLLA